MALIVEDGTIVDNANSYASLDTIKAYALNRGITLGTDSEIETQAFKAMDYIESKRNKFKGSKQTQNQPLQFPRIDVVIDDFELPINTIPNELTCVECQLIIEQKNGIDIMPTQDEAAVTSEKIGPMQTDYAVNPGNYLSPFMPIVDGLLAPLFKIVPNGITFIRV